MMKTIFRAAMLALLLGTAAAKAVAQQPTFRSALDEYQQARWSASFGRFVTLANNGDADAARIALFMLRYGPLLYGTYWDAPTENVEYWNNLSASGAGRAQPQFRPRHDNVVLPSRDAPAPAARRVGTREANR